MTPIRYRFKKDTLAWNLAWDAFEKSSNVRQWLRTRRYRWERTLDRVKPLAVISGGSDCDGMRYAGVSFHWTRADANESLDATYCDAEGPFSGDVVSGAEGRAWKASYEPDTRDRYAESMNY